MSPKGWPCRPRQGLSICSEPPLLFPRSCRCWRDQRLPLAQSAIVPSSDPSRNSVVKREDTWLPSAKSRQATASTITTPEHPLSSPLHRNQGLPPLATHVRYHRSRTEENAVASIPAESPCRIYHSGIGDA